MERYPHLHNADVLVSTSLYIFLGPTGLKWSDRSKKAQKSALFHKGI